jgi:ornithine cyclodeaminase/alanine dehydrogenase-like protein (mu-crystallin family)
MKLLVLSAADVHALLDHVACADAMRSALIAVRTGRAEQPLRTVVRPAGAAGLVALMPSYLHDERSHAYGLKALCISAANPAAGLDTHQGVVLLSSGRTGEPLALLNASAVTEIRTAAMSVVATGLLARPEADVLAIIGSGVQARAHAEALSRSRPLAEIRVTGRDLAKAERLAASLAEQTGVRSVACATVPETVAGAGIVVTATSSAQPVLRGAWLEPGMHVNAVGACQPTMRELDSAAMAAATIFADSRESLLAESGDYVLAAADGAVTPELIRAELGEVLTGQASGRASDTEITLFESLGLAIEDLAAAVCAYDRAVATGEGSWIDF